MDPPIFGLLLIGVVASGERSIDGQMCDKIGNDADTYTALASPKAASAPCSTTIVFEVLPPLVLRLVGRFLFDRLEPTGDKLCPDIISVKEGRPLRYFESHSRSVIPTRFIVWGEWDGGEWDGGRRGAEQSAKIDTSQFFVTVFCRRKFAGEYSLIKGESSVTNAC